MSDAEVLFERKGHAGLITLNRPKALNALTHDMVKAMADQLEAWRHDDAIRVIVVRAAGDKAFCAGGDIRKIYEQGKAGDPHQRDFFADEYRLNTTIKRYPKPYVALIDGIVMGGGVGVSVNGTHRVGTEKTTFAMPEVGIGFFPDVGGTYFLPRMPRETGMMLALTAGRLKQADALWAGVLTHAVASDDLDRLADALAETATVDAALASFARSADDLSPDEAPLAGQAERIGDVFGGSSVAAILETLDALADDGQEAVAAWASKQAATIRSKSPTSILLAYEQLRRGASLDFEACMRLEYRIVSRILQGSDFYEGVRALIVDKDNAPVWSPARLEDVADADIMAHFDLPEGGDLAV